MSLRLAIVLSHPVQYYSPWFRHLAAREELSVKVFYLWDFGVKETPFTVAVSALGVMTPAVLLT